MGITNTPHKCPCGQPFTLTHSLHCPKSGYTHLRHNENRDTFATLMDEICHDVETEPKLQSLEGESFSNKTTTTEDDARLSQTFFDVKLFNPHAKSCPKIYLTPTIIMRVSKSQNTSKEVWMWNTAALFH